MVPHTRFVMGASKVKRMASTVKPYTPYYRSKLMQSHTLLWNNPLLVFQQITNGIGKTGLFAWRGISLLSLILFQGFFQVHVGKGPVDRRLHLMGNIETSLFAPKTFERKHFEKSIFPRRTRDWPLSR